MKILFYQCISENFAKMFLKNSVSLIFKIHNYPGCSILNRISRLEEKPQFVQRSFDYDCEVADDHRVTLAPHRSGFPDPFVVASSFVLNETERMKERKQSG